MAGRRANQVTGAVNSPKLPSTLNPCDFFRASNFWLQALRKNNGDSTEHVNSMSTKMFSLIEDKRVECLSVMTVLTVKSYLDIVEGAYSNKGGIDGQRSKLTTKTAQTIRQRMVDDVARGAVLPPVVVGYLADEDEYKTLAATSEIDNFLFL
ncbi:hypothetical protein [Ensifer sp. SL37]|uniref:hypothetical protein n=1 Tax=Ensifer sp. SL37 TaxID=2995137 RepID=UPI0022725351|nr:hypothetical protein [Ensifer sp. SL37]MCY1744285.1 hypothetical protein [Ensifer sp. SL37]